MTRQDKIRELKRIMKGEIQQGTRVILYKKGEEFKVPQSGTVFYLPDNGRRIGQHA